MNQLDFNGVTKAVFGGVVGLFGFLFGTPDKWLTALLAFLVLDYLTGVTAAVITKQLSSKIGFVGICKKMLFLSIVAVAHLIDGAVGANGGLQALTVGFLVANEGLSILENCAKCGLPIPAKLLTTLGQLKQTMSQETEED